MIETIQSKSQTEHNVSQILNKLEALSDFSGPNEEFWNYFLQYITELCSAQAALLVHRISEQENWQTVHTWNNLPQSNNEFAHLSTRITKIAERSLQTVCTLESRTFVATQKDKRLLCALRLTQDKTQGDSAIIILISATVQFDSNYLISALRLVANIPILFWSRGQIEQVRQDMSHFAQTLDLTANLNQKTRYLTACMTVCNHTAALYSCSRVSLGWLIKKYVRLQSMSHIEKFEKKMEGIQSLEAAMEETLDQDEEIVYPPAKGSLSVTKAHETFSRKFGSAHMLSLPLRLDGQAVGILTCERSSQGFSENEIRGLALICDQISRRLSDLKKQDAWFGRKLVSFFRDKAAALLGVEHTFAKLLSILIAILLGGLIFGHWTYRVEAPFTLKTKELSYITAPFEGYVQDVFVETGDKVQNKSSLLALNAEEMVLQEAQSLANVQRYTREAEKARAENKLADMQIALSRLAQAEARLKQIRYKIDHARVRAPFTGLVVQGEKTELLGRPVHKGDVIFKVAKLKDMYAEIQISEKDIHEIAIQDKGEIAFASRPDLKFPVQVSKINPMAQAKEKKNVFITKAKPVELPRPWWRPGMSGVVKINAGKRSLLWILTHRTVDFLRLLFWW